MTYDGAYHKTNTVAYILEKWGKTLEEIPAVWDLMHRLNLSDNKISEKFPFVLLINDLAKDLFSMFNWGKTHENLRSMALEMEEKFINLTRFSDTRFANSKRRVYQNVLKMFNCITSQLEAYIYADFQNRTQPEARMQDVRDKGEAATNMKGRLVNMKTLLEMSGLADVYEEFGKMINCSQMYRMLPHERQHQVDESVNNLHCLALHFSTECSGDGCCKTPYFHKAKNTLLNENRFHEVPVFDLRPGRAGVSSQTRRQSQAATEEGNSNLLIEMVQKELIELTMELYEDIKNNAIRIEDRKIIETTKKILDVESLIQEMIDKEIPPLAFSLAKYPEYRLAADQLKIDFLTIPESTLEKQYKTFIAIIHKLYVKEVGVNDGDEVDDGRNVFSTEAGDGRYVFTSTSEENRDRALDEENQDRALDEEDREEDTDAGGSGVLDCPGDGRHVFSHPKEKGGKKKISSEEVWIRLFDEKNEHFEGIETVLHSAAVAATKNSCESVIESFVSTYEHHSNKIRNMSEDAINDEFTISKNGPEVNNADKIIEDSMDSYFKDRGGEWRFLFKTKLFKESKVINKLQKKKSPLGFNN